LEAGSNKRQREANGKKQLLSLLQPCETFDAVYEYCTLAGGAGGARQF
jgi:hypothetical protein